MGSLASSARYNCSPRFTGGYDCSCSEYSIFDSDVVAPVFAVGAVGVVAVVSVVAAAVVIVVGTDADAVDVDVGAAVTSLPRTGLCSITARAGAIMGAATISTTPVTGLSVRLGCAQCVRNNGGDMREELCSTRVVALSRESRWFMWSRR